MSTKTPPTLIKDLGLKLPTETSKRKYRYALYKCQCGKEFEAQTRSVDSGLTKTCRKCKQSDDKPLRAKRKTFKSGDDLIDHAYNDMIRKCYDQSHKEYHLFGAAGVTVCEDWLSDRNSFRIRFDNFSLMGKRKISILETEKEFNPKTVFILTNPEYKKAIMKRSEFVSLHNGTGLIFDIDKSCYLAYIDGEFISDLVNTDHFQKLLDNRKSYN